MESRSSQSTPGRASPLLMSRSSRKGGRRSASSRLARKASSMKRVSVEARMTGWCFGHLAAIGARRFLEGGGVLKIHEYQAKGILRGFGVATPRGEVTDDPAAAERICAELGGGGGGKGR